MASDFRNIARSPTGRFRSYGSMNDGKLFALWGLREEYKNDTEAVAKIKRAIDARIAAREDEELYRLKKLAGMPPSPVIEMVLEREGKNQGGWGDPAWEPLSRTEIDDVMKAQGWKKGEFYYDEKLSKKARSSRFVKVQGDHGQEMAQTWRGGSNATYPRQVRLKYKDHRSDKVYRLKLTKQPEGSNIPQGWAVTYTWGKSGGKTQEATRIFDTYEKAEAFMSKRESEKRGFGYTDADSEFSSKRKASRANKVASTDMTPAIMKAARYKGKKDYTGWLMSEKFDGFRAIWDGEKFISKNGNVFHAPEEFTKGFPKVALDGELWAGREEYQTAASIIRRQPKSKDYNAADWDKLQYVVFDAPGLYQGFVQGGPDAPMLRQNEHGAWEGGIRKYMQAEDFEDATKILNEWLDGVAKLPDAKWKTSGYYNLDGSPVDGWIKPTNIKLAHQTEIKDGSPEAIKKAMDKLVAKGAEGIMLRDPKAPYSAGRKSSIIKVKPAWTEEARVIGYEEGLGSNEGKVGSLLVESMVTPGLNFKIGIGLSDADRINPPKKGSVIEFKFNGKMKSGKPRHAAFLRVRNDMNRRRSAAIRNINGRRYYGFAATSSKRYARSLAQRVRTAAGRNARVIPRSGGFGIYVGPKRWN